MYGFDRTKTTVRTEIIAGITTFLFIDMFDTVGTLAGVCTKAGIVDKNGNIHDTIS